nr:MAG TPA: hypothetical protein [Caudoviricetes sp.]
MGHLTILVGCLNYGQNLTTIVILKNVKLLNGRTIK